MEEKFDYKVDMQVRDYEIDMQGIVHHSVYINYLEHCRNTYVKNEKDIDIHELHHEGFDIVLKEINQQYKQSLMPHEKFYVTCTMRLEGRLKIVFDQEIRRESDGELILSAYVICVCINNRTRKLCMPSRVKDAISMRV